MPKIKYEATDFRPPTMRVIKQANTIIREYAAVGFSLTLRQLYYQFVSRDLIPNRQREYKRLGDIISNARRAGLIDWNAIVDRTRNLQSLAAWDSPAQIIDASASQFRFDRWEDQPYYVEVWFEKDALMGVFERPANRYRMPFFSCRGYASDSEIWGAAQRLAKMSRGGLYPGRKGAIVLHFGDHDPSGIDMTRDIRDRLALFGAPRVDVRRIALNMNQIAQYQPPPNPAKVTDSRYEGYAERFGHESWELDALDPTVLADLVSREWSACVDLDAWLKAEQREAEARRELRAISDHYSEVAGIAIEMQEAREAAATEDEDDASEDLDEERIEDEDEDETEDLDEDEDDEDDEDEDDEDDDEWGDA